ncbi:MAG: HlyD family efflux transporter periplasmic adaptor subunit [Acidobacteriota bacterium]|nr:HlyD family efflux transporter periplasmic adaptor subunit [Acidobacteriota bacterium]
MRTTPVLLEAMRIAGLLLACTIAAGCQPEDTDHSHPHDDESEPGHSHGAEAEEAETWAVTVWGDTYGIFPEIDELVAGETSLAHTHVTILDGFSPIEEGVVEIVLGSGADEQVFAGTFLRSGIYNVEIAPIAEAELALAFRIRSAAGFEEIPGGRVRVGSKDDPGRLVTAETSALGSTAGEQLSFLLEQQWRTPFATAWISLGELSSSVTGLARVRAPAGGNVTLSPPIDAVLLADPWPFPGQTLRRGRTVFRYVPRTAAGDSRATLAARTKQLETELTTAAARFARLEDLYELEATSARELEEAGARVTRLETALGAARHDLETATAARGGGDAGAVALVAPFDGDIAVVTATPGAAVGAGEALARVVRTDAIWLELALSPHAARALGDDISGVVLSFPEGGTHHTTTGARLVSRGPEVDPATGSVTALVAVPAAQGLILGTTLHAEVLLGDSREGIVVPASAIIDDGGVEIVYLQLTGEEFTRQPVRSVSRQGDRVMVEGLREGQRLVTLGGQAIRRASLMATGEAQGHVH